MELPHCESERIGRASLANSLEHDETAGRGAILLKSRSIYELARCMNIIPVIPQNFADYTLALRQ